MMRKRRKEPSQFVSTFEIRRGGITLLRIEHDSKVHGSEELSVSSLVPYQETIHRMTLDELEEALRK